MTLSFIITREKSTSTYKTIAHLLMWVVFTGMLNNCKAKEEDFFDGANAHSVIPTAQEKIQLLAEISPLKINDEELAGLSMGVSGMEEFDAHISALQQKNDHIKRPVYSINGLDLAVFLLPIDGECMARAIWCGGYDVILPLAKIALDYEDNCQIVARQMLTLFSDFMTLDQRNEKQQGYVDWLNLYDNLADEIGMLTYIESSEESDFARKGVLEKLTQKSICEAFIDMYYGMNGKMNECIEATPAMDGQPASILDVIANYEHFKYVLMQKEPGGYSVHITNTFGQPASNIIYALLSDDYSQCFMKPSKKFRVGEHVDQLIPLYTNNGTINWQPLVRALRLEKHFDVWSKWYQKAMAQK